MRTSIFTCLWPGLVRLWFRGEARGLANALCFAVLLNGALIASFVWPDLVGALLRDALWFVVAIVWVVSTWSNWRVLPPAGSVAAAGAGGEDLFIRAQAEYLKGHWVEAESLLAQRLQRQPGDCDARLMLGTLFRHTGQLNQAEQQLDLLDRQPGSEKWRLEAAQERHSLKQMAEQSQRSSSENNEPAYSGDEQVAVDEADASHAA